MALWLISHEIYPEFPCLVSMSHMPTMYLCNNYYLKCLKGFNQNHGTFGQTIDENQRARISKKIFRSLAYC